jgi:hypothetical protein
VVKPDVLSRNLDVHAARLTAEVVQVLAAIDAALSQQVRAIAAEGAEGVTAGIAGIRVPTPLRTQLRTVMLAAATRARDLGATAVANEIARQLQPDVAAPNRDGPYYPGTYARRRAAGLVTLDAEYPTDQDAARDALLRAAVERAVQDECDRREASARSAALAALATAPTAPGAELAPIAEARAKGALEELSHGRTADNVQGVVNIGFGVGRSDGADAHTEATSGGAGGATGAGGARLVAKVYSAVLDYGTCDECARWDGAEFPIEYDETAAGNVKAPNPNCAGGTGKCRCIWTYITADEAQSIVPAQKGPIPRGY